MTGVRRFEVYVAATGNVFMAEIAQWLVEALGDLGRRAQLHTTGVPRAGPGTVNLLVAPHEYLELTLTDPAERRAAAAASIPVCTEQPGTNWFEIQLQHTAPSPLVLDINALGAAEQQRRGVQALHLPLGYHRSVDRWHGRRDTERPIDVLFLGSLTPRREAALARLARPLQSLRCRLVLFEPTRPARAGDPGFHAGEDKYRLLASAKVLLNVHRNEVPYFESVRALEAAANGAVVVTEPCLDLRPFEAVDHVVTAPLDTLGAICAALANDAAWLGDVRDAAYHHLTTSHRLVDNVAALLPALDAAAAAAQAAGSIRTSKRLGSQAIAEAVAVAGSVPLPAVTAPAPNGQTTQSLFKRVLINQMQLRRRLDELECLVHHGSTRHDEITTTPSWQCLAPDVSVVVPCYNYGRFVTAAIDSVASSSDVVVEIIVIDDHSDDGASEIVRRYAASHPWLPLMLVTRHANAGLAAARNLGFELARAPFVFPLDADNEVYPHALCRLREALLEHGDAAAAYGILEVFHDREGLLSATDWNVERLAAGPYIDAAALLRKDAWAAVGGYSTNVSDLYGWEDYDLWLNLANHGRTVRFVAEILVRYRSHGESMIHTTNIETASVATFLRRRHRNVRWPQPLGS